MVMRSDEANVPTETTLKIVPSPADTAQSEPIRLRQLVERVVARTGMKKGEARRAIQATLAVLGEALADGEDLHVPPLGKLRVTRSKPTARGQMMVLKLVQNQPAVGETEPDAPS